MSKNNKLFITSPVLIVFKGFYAGQWKEGRRHGYGIRGWVPIDQLKDGAISVKQLFAATPSRRVRPATISGIEDVFNDVKDVQEKEEIDQQKFDASIQLQPMRKTYSSPATLNRQFTFEDLNMETIHEPSSKEMESSSSKKTSSKYVSFLLILCKDNLK